MQRKQLIDSDKDQYPNTRQLAEAIHAQHPDIGGPSWIGALSVNDEVLRSGDGAHIERLPSLILQADDEAEIVLFDLR